VTWPAVIWRLNTLLRIRLLAVTTQHTNHRTVSSLLTHLAFARSSWAGMTSYLSGAAGVSPTHHSASSAHAAEANAQQHKSTCSFHAGHPLASHALAAHCSAALLLNVMLCQCCTVLHATSSPDSLWSWSQTKRFQENRKASVTPRRHYESQIDSSGPTTITASGAWRAPHNCSSEHNARQ
jgi:hypothetical protein